MRKNLRMKKIASLVLVTTLLTTSVFSQDVFGTGMQAEEKSSVESTINDDLKLWYTSPANINSAETNGGEWMQQSLPLGNGNLGNLIFGGVAKERIHFNEKSLWTGGPSASRPNYQFGNKGTAYTAAEIEAYRKVLDDKSKNVFNDSMSGYGYVPIRFPGENNLNKGSYQDFGDIWLDFNAMGITQNNVTNYRRELNLQTGIAATSFTYNGVDYVREHFVSSPDNVMVTKVSASKEGTLDVTIQMELNNSGLNGTTTVNEAENTCTIEGTVRDNGLKFRTTMKVIQTGGTIKANSNKTYTVSDADSIVIIMAAETDYKNDYPTYRDTEKNLTEVVDGRVNAAATKSFDELKENHLADHQGLFDRVELDLGETVTDIPTNELMDAYRSGDYSKYLEVLSFQFGRYLTIAGSRGELPSNLVGLWTVGDSAWTGDYHFNVNVQMNYWPVYVTNLAECGTTMVEYMENLREPGRLTAERVHGITGAVDNHTGFVVHTENNPFGMTAPSNQQEYGWNPTGAAWAIQNLWAHYEFTQDEAYLRDTIYPIMKEAALFWDQYLWTSGYQVIHDEASPYDGEARLVVAPSFSEEQGPTAVGTTYDQSLVWELYNECVKAAEILGVDESLAARWKDNMQKLDPIEINATNGIKEWYEETRVGLKNGHNQSYAQAGNLAEIAVPNSGWNIGHPGEQRHASHLVGLYPGTLINKENEEYMSAAIQSLTERGVYSTGWSKANKINLWARTGNGDMAYTLLKNLIGGKSAGLQYNLFDSHGSGGGETMMNGSPVWQIDGNYGLTAGVAEMLIQSQLGYVQFLPAIPEAWADGNVQGLKARGNFTIGQTWYNGAPDEFTVRYDGDEESSVFVGEYSEITDAKVTLNGKTVSVKKDRDNERISFEAKQGETYVIDMSGTNSEKVKEYAESYLSEIDAALVAAREELAQAIEEQSDDLNDILRKAKLMNELYADYPFVEEKIYYMTTEEGLTLKEIDSMYHQLRSLKDALVENKGDLEDFNEAAADFRQIEMIMQEQMSNRMIAVSNDGTAMTLTKSADAAKYEIRYTLDGTTPGADSEIYTDKIPVNGSVTVKAALFLEDQRVSPVYETNYAANLKFDSVATNVNAWDGYGPEMMIDCNSDTRWASYSPSGDIEVILSFNKETTISGLYFEKYVSAKNYVDKYEIWALDGSEYKQIMTGEKLLSEEDATGTYFASKGIEFDAITTKSVKFVIKEPYGEPTFWEIQPLQGAEQVTETPDTSKLEELIADAEKVDRKNAMYGKSDKDLKKAFEAAILDARESLDKSQAALDSRETFLKDRYLRICSGESVAESEVVRLFGESRYDTGYAVADALKEALGVEKFEAVVVATGKNFADALAGSYLAVEKNAPILLTNGKDDNIAELHAYIAANVAEGGKVYILGGEGAVPTAVDAIEKYDVVRLFGDSRYDTNLAILDEAGVSGDSIIVATGKNFADSLSASAAKLPILLVKPNATLNDAQKAILAGMKNIYIVGGEGAVSAEYEAELKAFGEVTRVFGESRYDTSVEVAKTFCKDVDFAVAASGKNFPDGLCGGPLAAALNAPLVLTKDSGADAAAGYVAENGIASGYVLGGDGALADETVVEVFALENADAIK